MSRQQFKVSLPSLASQISRPKPTFLFLYGNMKHAILHTKQFRKYIEENRQGKRPKGSIYGCFFQVTPLIWCSIREKKKNSDALNKFFKKNYVFFFEIKGTIY